LSTFHATLPLCPIAHIIPYGRKIHQSTLDF
jgi:hypothetical protein